MFPSVQTPENCLEAVKLNGVALKYVRVQTPEICLAAVKSSGSALIYVKEQTLEICLEAVKTCGYALNYVKKEFRTNEMYILAFKYDIRVFRDIGEHTYELCLLAVKCSGYALKYVEEKFKTREICLEAVKTCSIALKYVDEQTPEICLAAVKVNGKALEFVEDRFKTGEICFEAVKNDAFAIIYIKQREDDDFEYMSEEEIDEYNYFWQNTYIDICLEAFKNNPEVYDYIYEEYRGYLPSKYTLEIPLEVIPFTHIKENTTTDEIVDAISFESPKEGEIFAFFQKESKFYPIASFTTLQKFVEKAYRESTNENIYSPFHNTLICVKDIIWVKF